MTSTSELPFTAASGLALDKFTGVLSYLNHLFPPEKYYIHILFKN